MKYNEKANRYAPRISKATLMTPPSAAMIPCDDGVWVHYVEYCEAIRRQKRKRCVAMASNCRLRARWFGDNAFYKKERWASQWHKRWLELADKFK